MKKAPSLPVHPPSPEPALTKQGLPRKRAAGGGRPNAGRSCGLPRITPAAYATLKAYSEAQACSIAEAVEAAASKLEA